MQFIDLKTQQLRIKDKIKQHIEKVLNHNAYIQGPEVRELEGKLAKYGNVKYAVGVASGTDALLMPLMAYDVGLGDAIFTSTFTFIATAEVIQLLGATPVFIDIDPNTFNIDPLKLEKEVKNTEKKGELTPRGIIPVDLFGQPADYDEINETAKKYELFVLEDAAQSFGALYKDQKPFPLVDVAATSFFPAKPLGCYGDGGMVFTNSEEMVERLTSIRVHGQGSNKYENIRVGINGRLDTIQAAILLAKFEIFDKEIESRQEIANRYHKGLESFVKIPFVKEYNRSVWAQYSITHPEREKIMSHLKEAGIPTAIYYPIPLHLQEAFSNLGYGEGDFPISENISKKIFSLPFHPYLKQNDQEKIINTIHQALK